MCARRIISTFCYCRCICAYIMSLFFLVSKEKAIYPFIVYMYKPLNVIGIILYTMHSLLYVPPWIAAVSWSKCQCWAKFENPISIRAIYCSILHYWLWNSINEFLHECMQACWVGEGLSVVVLSHIFTQGPFGWAIISSVVRLAFFLFHARYCYNI